MRGYGEYTQAVIEKAKDLYLKGYSYPEIAKQLEIRRWMTIYDWKKKFSWDDRKVIALKDDTPYNNFSLQEPQRYECQKDDLCFDSTELLEMRTILAQSKAKPSQGVYFLIQSKEIVYIGQTTNILRRINSHIRKRKFHFDRYAFISLPKESLEATEKLYIKKFRPKYNTVHINPTKIILKEVKR